MKRIIFEYMIFDFKFYREQMQYKTLKSIKPNNILIVGKFRPPSKKIDHRAVNNQL